MANSNNDAVFWVLLLVAALGISVVLSFWLAPTIFFQNKQTGEQIAQESLDRESAINNYRWFRSQWYDIQAQRDQLETYRSQHEQFHETYGDDATEWPRDVRQRHSRLTDRVSGTENQLASMIAEYNARQSDATRALFQCGLPYSVDEKLFIADATGIEYTSQEAKKQTPPEEPSQCQFAQDPAEQTAN